ncbi:zinc finger CCCH domain-containing protein 3-like [Diospyros lotus]|uniref:zinc finger CCCH domain-containing protein 3-like n=1 Tax=Diospyros lotus TaxID=55363 RepID=UPI0022592141|nr:zinc finger CCCH domain-containing protein 3-like [Diospyros lotus]
MPENRQAQSNGAVYNQPVDDLEDAISRLKIGGNDDRESGGVANSCPYPERPGEPDCIYYLRTGMCGYGSNCKFNHPAAAGKGGQYRGELPERVGQPDCGYYLKTGTCKYGSTCKYHHPRDRHGAGPVPLNILGLPMRQDEKPCPFYMRTGLCKFGAGCKFDHPQPASAGNILPIPGPATYGSSGSTVLPSSGLPLVGGVSTVSLTRPPYLSAPPVQGPQGYMPIVVSPSPTQGVSHGWNTYLGLSPTSVPGSNLVYTSKSHGESGSSGLVHLLSTSIPHLPERPDQPECRHFMSTGTCKYGYECKYHHPRERIEQLATNSLGPLGLPLRPGQAVCSYYSLYGLCKYGPTCKFDHPLTGYSYNYSLSFPTLPVFDSSMLQYQRNSPPVLLSDTYPPKSSKGPDWVRRRDAAANKNQKVDIETTENSPEQAGSPDHLPAASSELPNDESD